MYLLIASPDLCSSPGPRHKFSLAVLIALSITELRVPVISRVLYYIFWFWWIIKSISQCPFSTDKKTRLWFLCKRRAPVGQPFPRWPAGRGWDGGGTPPASGSHTLVSAGPGHHKSAPQASLPHFNWQYKLWQRVRKEPHFISNCNTTAGPLCTFRYYALWPRVAFPTPSLDLDPGCWKHSAPLYGITTLTR